MMCLDQAAAARDDHEEHEYDTAHIVAAIRTFVEAGGRTVEDPNTKHDKTRVCSMDEKPSFLSTYPYVDKATQPTDEALLIIVDPELGLVPRVVVRQVGSDNLKSRAFLFPELGFVLDGNGLSRNLKVDGILADLVHEALAVPHFELETSGRGILAKIRRSQAADRIREMISSKVSQTAPDPETVLPAPLLTVNRSQERQESMYGKARAQRRVEIAESWLKLDPEERERLVADWIIRAEELGELLTISRLGYIKRVTVRLGAETIAPHKQYSLKVLLGGNLWSFSVAEETETAAQQPQS